MRLPGHFGATRRVCAAPRGPEPAVKHAFGQSSVRASMSQAIVRWDFRGARQSLQWERPFPKPFSSSISLEQGPRLQAPSRH